MSLVGPRGETLWVLKHLPKSVPEGWRYLGEFGPGGRCWYRGPLSVIVTGATQVDGKRWLHLSCSRPDRLPSWDELREVKETFLGDIYAIQVLPPKRFYVNVHPNVLHLFSCVDGHPLPEFSGAVAGRASL